MFLRQLVLLLALFLKPLLVNRMVNNRSSAAAYKRIFVRNVVCTIVIMLILALSTIVGYIYLSTDPEAHKVRGMAATNIHVVEQVVSGA